MSEATLPRWQRVTGWVLTGLFVAFMIFDVGIKLIGHPEVERTSAALGIPPGQAFTIGVIEAICLALYVVPRTAVLGAVLFTAVMGGAIATHMQVGSPLASHTLFGVYMGLILWGGVWLRDPALRAVMPVRR